MPTHTHSTNKDCFFAAYDGKGVFHVSALQAGQTVATGQPTLEVFDDAKALMAKLDTLNCKPVAADLAKASTDAEKLMAYEKVAQEKTIEAVAVAAKAAVEILEKE